MGAPVLLVYYGLRWEVISPDEVDALERRDDPRLVAAQRHRLKYWWGNANEDAHFLLIGHEIGKFGWEGVLERTIADEELFRIMEATRANLKAAGFDGEPSLHCQFERDD